MVYIFGDRCGGQACRTGDIIDRNVHVKPPVLMHLQIIEYFSYYIMKKKMPQHTRHFFTHKVSEKTSVLYIKIDKNETF